MQLSIIKSSGNTDSGFIDVVTVDNFDGAVFASKHIISIRYQPYNNTLQVLLNDTDMPDEIFHDGFGNVWAQTLTDNCKAIFKGAVIWSNPECKK